MIVEKFKETYFINHLGQESVLEEEWESEVDTDDYERESEALYLQKKVKILSLLKRPVMSTPSY